MFFVGLLRFFIVIFLFIIVIFIIVIIMFNILIIMFILLLVLPTTAQVVSEKVEFEKDPVVSSFRADMSLLATTLGSPFILVLFLAAAARSSWT